MIILVATFFTVAYSCRMSFLLASLYTAKNCTYISDDNDYLMINGIIFLFPFSIVGGINIIWLIFSFPPTIFLPVWLKMFVLFLIFIAVIRGLIRLKTNKSNNFFIKFFVGLIWFFPQTFRILSNITILRLGKSKLKLSEVRWTELFIYGALYSNLNKFSKYLDFIRNSYFLNSIFILIIIIFIL